jgi:uncharacterized protein YjbI with pentapeptide repeats
MSSQTCAYITSESDPESWHETESSTFYPNKHPTRSDLEITKWHCPHPPLDRNNGSDDDSDDQYCVFHTDPADVPNDVDEREALLDALQDVGNSPRTDRPEHRGQFVGATFGPIDLSGETIVATDHHDIRFDYARFQSDDENLDFTGTTFVTEGQYSISFVGTEFTTTGEGDVLFGDATFRSGGRGDVWFGNTRFRSNGEGNVVFVDATFRTDGEGDVWLGDTRFRADGEGHVVFHGAVFRTDGEGQVWFDDAWFQTDGEGDVLFGDTRFRTDGKGSVWFGDTRFRADGEGDVLFGDTRFRATGEGHVGFARAKFRAGGDGDVLFSDTRFRGDGEGDVLFSDARFQTGGEGHVGFQDAILANTDFRSVEFAKADFSGVDFTGVDLREANVADISLNGSTTCERLNEGYRDDCSTRRSFVPARLRRLYGSSDFNPEDWDATARAYHQLKIVFSGHGLVGRARNMHVRERRARSLEAKAASGWFDRRYLLSFLSRVFTGYGVQVRNLAIWMFVLFLLSTAVYVKAGVEDTLANNISYSVLAFTVAPPKIPSGVGSQVMMMIETFLGTLSIVVLGYILGNRQRF